MIATVMMVAAVSVAVMMVAMVVVAMVVVTAAAGWRNSIHAPCVSAGTRELWMRARSYAGQWETRGPATRGGKTVVIGR